MITIISVLFWADIIYMVRANVMSWLQRLQVTKTMWCRARCLYKFILHLLKCFYTHFLWYAYHRKESMQLNQFTWCNLSVGVITTLVVRQALLGLDSKFNIENSIPLSFFSVSVSLTFYFAFQSNLVVCSCWSITSNSVAALLLCTRTLNTSLSYMRTVRSYMQQY